MLRALLACVRVCVSVHTLEQVHTGVKCEQRLREFMGHRWVCEYRNVSPLGHTYVCVCDVLVFVEGISRHMAPHLGSHEVAGTHSRPRGASLEASSHGPRSDFWVCSSPLCPASDE